MSSTCVSNDATSLPSSALSHSTVTSPTVRGKSSAELTVAAAAAAGVVTVVVTVTVRAMPPAVVVVVFVVVVVGILRAALLPRLREKRAPPLVADGEIPATCGSA
eukprot:COSAG04_NODE_259_length_18733_cov_5.191371_5_plen_105_part_00